MIRDPRALQATPRLAALVGLATLITDAPWTVDDDDLTRVRAAGVSDEGVVQVVTIAAVFNHLVRAADATGIDFDYATALPRYAVDRTRQPLPRPAPADWPRPAPRLPLSLRPDTQAALAAWKAYAFTPDAILGARDRAVLARAAAFHCCDAAGVAEHEGAEPKDAREAALAAFAAKLTLAPWTMSEGDLGPLRALRLDDRGLLHVIAVVGLTNALARVRLALG